MQVYWEMKEALTGFKFRVLEFQVGWLWENIKCVVSFIN